jgi:hypothetical protein
MEWKDIKSLSEKEARKIVKNYLLNHGFGVDEINPDDLPEGKKSPDFVIKEGNDIKGYCEIKTPAHNLNQLTQLYQWDTTFYKLRRFLHTAKKQFNDYDPQHEKPWVVVFTSIHPQLNWESFTNNVIGAVAFNGQVIRDFRDKKFLAESNQDLLSIDMIVWFQVNYIDRRKVYQVRFFINKDRALLDEINKLSNRLKPKPENKIK